MRRRPHLADRRLAHAAVTAAAFAIVSCVAGAASAQTSALWGAHGELWSPQSRLPDFSHAGYRAGEAPLPDVPVAVSVLDFGAKGDGTADDGPAIQAAIDAIDSGAVLLPKGRYRLSQVLRVEKSGVVLRGEGSGPSGSVLVVDTSLSDVLGADVKWSYSGGFLHFRSTEAGSLVAPVTKAAPRGDRTLSASAALKPGQLIELRQVDDGSGSLGRHLHAELANSGDCAYQVPLRFDWPVRVDAVDAGEVSLRQPLRTDVRAEWQPELWTLPALSEVGVEHLRVEFPDVPYAGHLKEPGYNAVFFSDGVVDAWVRDVTVVNADDAFLTESRVKNVSFVQVRTEGRPGHHGFNLNQSADVLIDGFVLDSEWWHSVTVDHRTNGTVVTRGQSALPMSLDHHRDGPFENLFTELGAYGFQSGGSACAGPQAGARNTYWNLAAPMTAPLLWTVLQTNVVGDLAPELVPIQTPDREWLEQLGAPDPANLYDAQLAARLCGAPSSACVRLAWDVATGSCVETARPCGSETAAEPGGCGCSLSSREGSARWLVLGLGIAVLAWRRWR